MSSTYDENEIYVRSTNVNRTIKSAQSQLMGFYPPGTGPKFKKNFRTKEAIPPFKNANFDVDELMRNVLPERIQPIPIHIESYDVLLHGEDYCPAIQRLAKEQKKSENYKSFNEEFKDFFNIVAKIVNDSDASNLNINKVAKYASDLYCDMAEQNPLPEGLSEDVWKAMAFFKELETQYIDVGHEMQRKLLATHFFNLISLYVNKKIENDPNFKLKYIMLSAHDSTLSPFMAALNLTSWQCVYQRFKNGSLDEFDNCVQGHPLFASQIIIELHSRKKKGEKKFYVKILYNGEKMNLCQKKNHQCDWNEFNARLTNYVVLNWDEECAKEEHKNFLAK